MTPVILKRIDPSKNMARFYRMQLQPTLFGEMTAIREWDRIGQSGTCRHDQYETADAARASLDATHHSKLRRGYSTIVFV